MNLSLGRKIQIAFLFALLLLITLGFLSYQSAVSLTSALGWEQKTQEVLSKLEETLKLTLDGETAMRGYLITGKEKFLEPYFQAEKQIPNNLRELEKLIATNQGQRDDFAVLKTQILQKLEFKKLLKETKEQEGLVAAQNLLETGRGKEQMDRIRVSIEKMKATEQNLLKIREDELNKTISNTLILLFLGVTTGILSLGFANFAIGRELKKRLVAENDLIEANKTLESRVEARTKELQDKNEELEDQVKQRKQAETYRKIALEAGNLGTWMYDPKTDKTEIDERGLFLFGFSNDDFDGLGQSIFQRIHEEDFPNAEKSFQKTLNEKIGFNAEFRVVLPDGSVIWNHCTGQPQINEDGEILYLIGNCYNITKRKEREIELKASEEFNRSVFENSPDCVKILELDGSLHSMNSNGLCLMEIDDISEFVGKQWIDFWQGDENEMAYQAVQSAIKGNSEHFEGYCKTAKGTGKWWDVSVAPIYGANGEVVRIISTSRDITQRREAEKEREKLLKNEKNARQDAEVANRLRDEFLATVSHELRAPLNSILGWGRLLEKGKLDETTTEKAVGTIVRNAESQNRLINDLLDVSRIISGKLRLEIRTIKPLAIVEAALESVKPAADAKNIKLEVKEDGIISHISGDPNRLQQVIWNLLSNAIKFTPNGGVVTLEMERDEDFIEMRVKDSGVGINDEFLPHVFDRFRQADASSIRKFGGLGLGLAIVRHITEMHGGTVAAYSEGEGKGSTFTVRLPLLNSADKPEAELDSTEETSDLINTPQTNLDGLLILVVDDEFDTQQLLKQFLTSAGATVITADSVETALIEIQDKSPDVLVSDIGMPDEDGYSLIRKVRNLHNKQQKHISAIALTAFTRSQDRIKALSAGFQSHVSKPVEPDELIMVIASLVGRLQTGK